MRKFYYFVFESPKWQKNGVFSEFSGVADSGASRHVKRAISRLNQTPFKRFVLKVWRDAPLGEKIRFYGTKVET